MGDVVVHRTYFTLEWAETSILFPFLLTQPTFSGGEVTQLSLCFDVWIERASFFKKSSADIHKIREN